MSTPSSLASSKTSAIEQAGRCGSCQGSGARPTTGVSVVLGALSISWAPLPTYRLGMRPWMKRLLLVLLGLAIGAGGPSMSTLENLVNP